MTFCVNVCVDCWNNSTISLFNVFFFTICYGLEFWKKCKVTNTLSKYQLFTGRANVVPMSSVHVTNVQLHKLSGSLTRRTTCQTIPCVVPCEETVRRGMLVCGHTGRAQVRAQFQASYSRDGRVYS